MLNTLTFIGFIVAVVLTSPIHILWRCIIRLLKHFRKDIGSILDPFSSLLACDYFSGKLPKLPIIIHMVVEGNMEVDQVEQIVSERWLESKYPETGLPLYPQFKQYPYNWLGFTCWKNVPNFSLKNHLHLDPTSPGEVKTEAYINRFTEQLLNKPFERNQSPWEFHLVRNYYNEEIHSGPMSVVFLRLHHCLADGFSLVYAMYEGLLGLPRENFKVPSGRRFEKKKPLLKRLYILVSLPFMWIYELGQLLRQYHKVSELKVPDKEMTTYQYYAISKPIPMNTVKHIKNYFEVSFTSVLLSAVASGLSYTLEKKRKRKVEIIIDEESQKKGSREEDEKIYCFSALPLPSKSRCKNRLMNHATAAVFPLPVDSLKTSVERLRESNQVLEETKNSVVPQIAVFYYSFLGSFPYAICKRLATKNRATAIGFSNFPFSQDPVLLNGRKIITAGAASGTMQECCGISLLILSYDGCIRMSVSGSNAVLTREEFDSFVNIMEKEICHLNFMTAQ